MFNAELIPEGLAMTDARPQLVFEASISRMAATIAAGLLVSVGIVFQLCELGFGSQSANAFWFVHLIAVNLWNLLALHLDAPGIGEILRFWPLLLVGFGLAILMALKTENREVTSRSSREGVTPRA
jgi:hypothetical protein